MRSKCGKFLPDLLFTLDKLLKLAAGSESAARFCLLHHLVFQPTLIRNSLLPPVSLATLLASGRLNNLVLYVRQVKKQGLQETVED